MTPRSEQEEEMLAARIYLKRMEEQRVRSGVAPRNFEMLVCWLEAHFAGKIVVGWSGPGFAQPPQVLGILKACGLGPEHETDVILSDYFFFVCDTMEQAQKLCNDTPPSTYSFVWDRGSLVDENT